GGGYAGGRALRPHLPPALGAAARRGRRDRAAARLRAVQQPRQAGLPPRPPRVPGAAPRRAGDRRRRRGAARRQGGGGRGGDGGGPRLARAPRRARRRPGAGGAPVSAFADLLHRREEPLWQRLALAPLVPASGLFAAAAGARRALYATGLLRRSRAAIPVVSVGNLAVGGAGKTPVTIHLVDELMRRGLRVAVLSRGYGGAGRGAR